MTRRHGDDELTPRIAVSVSFVALVLIVALAILVIASVLVSDKDTKGSTVILAFAAAGVPSIITTLVAFVNHAAVRDIQRKVNGELDTRLYENSYMAARNALGRGNVRESDAPGTKPSRKKV